MPRGYRVAVFNVEAEMARKPQMSMIFAAAAWLPASCWCDREIVGVQQREVWWGVTRSCGRGDCVNPDSGEQVIGKAVTETLVVSDLPCIKAPACPGNRKAYSPHNMARRWAQVGQEPVAGQPPPRRDAARRPYELPRPRTPADEIAVRRDLVEVMWREGKRRFDIALYLDVPLYIVMNDLAWLQARGRVSRARQNRVDR